MATRSDLAASEGPGARVSVQTDSTDSPILSVDRLTIAFPRRTGLALAANNVSFEVRERKVLGLVGESGCGKSVTLRSIIGLVPSPGRVVAGTIRWQGANLVGLAERQWQNVRGTEIAMVFQDPTAVLNPVFSIGDQLIEVLRTKDGLSRKLAAQRAIELLGRVGIPAPTSRRREYPHQLSGGMRQRVMIALAIACRPKLLLADEPTTALDVTIQDQILRLLMELQGEEGMAMIIVSHDLGVIAQTVMKSP